MIGENGKIGVLFLGDNGVLFVKIGARVLDLKLDMCFGL